MRSLTSVAVVLILALCGLAPPARADQSWTCQGVTFALPDGVAPYCTKTFTLVAICDGTDQVMSNLFTPWEPFPIVVTSLALSFYTTLDVILNAQAGNGYVPDIMLIKGNGTGKEFAAVFPAGSGMAFPAKVTPQPAGQWLDLHFGCTGYTTPPPHQIGFYLVGYRPFAPNP